MGSGCFKIKRRKHDEIKVFQKEEEEDMMGSGPSELGPDWTDLTRECLLDIFSRLNMEERFTGPMMVCKTWMNACKEPSLNSVFDLEPQFQSLPTSNSWLWCPQFEENIDSLLRAVVDRSEGGLKEIRVRHCTNRSISYVAERCPNLEVLCVKYCPKVTYDSMWDIALKCPKLKELDISCSYEISCECVKMLGTNCKNLEILKWSLLDPLEITELKHTRFVPRNYLEKPSIMTLGNLQVSYIRRHMHQLRHLELRFSTLNDKGLANLCKACSKLEYLDLFGCKNLTSVGVTTHTSTLKNLKEVNFFFLV